eukprot:8933069-Alexandrium_andersonii.AAC.1
MSAVHLNCGRSCALARSAALGAVCPSTAQVACLCIRAFDFFYPPGPKERGHANTVLAVSE